MDDKFKDYEELAAYLGDLPMTWYPDLIRRMVIAAYKKKVFLPNKAGDFIKMVIRREEDGDWG